MKKEIRKTQIITRFIRLLTRFSKDTTGGSMIESGLLIALSLILFLMLIGLVTNVYSWIEEQFNIVIDFFITQ